MSHFPSLEYSAALIGWGSDVLGYDDAQSTDHNWGPRFQLFLAQEGYEQVQAALHSVLSRKLPSEYLGQPVRFPIVGGEHQQKKAGEASHNIEIQTIKSYFGSYLGCDPYREMEVADWLTFPEHKLLGVTSGEVFHDGLNELELIRQKFRYYPRDVWLYLLAAQWEKISEEQAFVGRCGHVGDELGSALIAARQIKNLMRLCFLMERKYAPYSKWFGTAFNRLACADELSPIFVKVIQAREWMTRQEFLAKAYEVVARMHNALRITVPLQETAAPYFGRPYLVIGDERYTAELRKLVTNEEVRKIAHNLGSVNQFIDSTDQINDLKIREKLKEVYA
ncbi:MAG TPA: DUF4037 domain-containing protein [Anaerolineales bacterium]|nr:DUF4037 domain-containing protein [Anaerolineales bacterium]